MSTQTTLEALAAEVRRLSDIEEIKQIILKYGLAADNKLSLDEMMSLFTEDAVWEGLPITGRYKGKALIRELFARRSGVFQWTLHHMICPLIEVAEDGQTARGSWQLFELATMRMPRTEETAAVWIDGAFDSKLVKEDSGWKFKSVTLDIEVLSPYEEGWAKIMFDAKRLDMASLWRRK